MRRVVIKGTDGIKVHSLMASLALIVNCTRLCAPSTQTDITKQDIKTKLGSKYTLGCRACFTSKERHNLEVAKSHNTQAELAQIKGNTWSQTGDIKRVTGRSIRNSIHNLNSYHSTRLYCIYSIMVGMSRVWSHKKQG